MIRVGGFGCFSLCLNLNDDHETIVTTSALVQRLVSMLGWGLRGPGCSLLLAYNA